jgi:hypothetical protein
MQQLKKKLLQEDKVQEVECLEDDNDIWKNTVSNCVYLMIREGYLKQAWQRQSLKEITTACSLAGHVCFLMFE